MARCKAMAVIKYRASRAERPLHAFLGDRELCWRCLQRSARL